MTEESYNWNEIPREVGHENILDHAAQSKKNLEAFIRGLKNAIQRMESQGQKPKNAYELLKKAEAKL